MRRALFLTGCSLRLCEAARWCTVPGVLPVSPPESQLIDECDVLTATPIPIGTLFKSLSKESRQVLIDQKMSIENFLLKNKDKFSVFKKPDAHSILVSKLDAVPLTARRGVEATSDRQFSGQSNDPLLQKIYTVLKYIPNEWSSFVSLGIPEEVRLHCMNKKPKLFFESNPKYFEVKAQGLRSHTFEVRRSLALRKATAGGVVKQ